MDLRQTPGHGAILPAITPTERHPNGTTALGRTCPQPTGTRAAPRPTGRGLRWIPRSPAPHPGLARSPRLQAPMPAADLTSPRTRVSRGLALPQQSQSSEVPRMPVLDPDHSRDPAPHEPCPPVPTSPWKCDKTFPELGSPWARGWALRQNGCCCCEGSHATHGAHRAPQERAPHPPTHGHSSRQASEGQAGGTWPSGDACETQSPPGSRGLPQERGGRA